jgi:hypothetical protein
MQLDLLAEFLARVEEREGVIVGLGEEFDAAGGVELMKCVHHFGDILLKLLEGDAGEGVGDAEAAFVHFDGVEERAVGGQIAFMGDFPAYFGVFVVVEVVAVGVKDAVAAESEGLVDLEVKTDGWHLVLAFFTDAGARFSGGGIVAGDC